MAMDLNNIRFPVQLSAESIQDSVHDYVINTVDAMVDISIETSVWKPVNNSLGFMVEELV
jgi:hypothetical protein